MLLVDFSASGEFGTRRQFKRDIEAEICAILAFSAIKNSDRVGLIAFTDRIEKFLRPRKERSTSCASSARSCTSVPGAGLPIVGGALQFMYRTVTKRAVVFVISDLLAHGYEQPLRVAARKHDVIAITVTDPREEELPPDRPPRSGGRRDRRARGGGRLEPPHRELYKKVGDRPAHRPRSPVPGQRHRQSGVVHRSLLRRAPGPLLPQAGAQDEPLKRPPAARARTREEGRGRSFCSSW